MVGTTRGRDAVSTTFELLANRRRRYALRCLRTYENSITLADLADEVAVLECNEPLTEISAERVKRVYLSLYHTHVPKLADASYVRYDQEQDMVALRDRAEGIDLLEAYLEPVSSTHATE
ncbi:hypothetical protein ACFQGT_04535 [Natrialbaceae archaeon GCM10025810]|uniref:DUF7344 domain-containing protein n=1 Tax=Halovalidus salilacus TaxID=3075124 RepID=UPI003606F864